MLSTIHKIGDLIDVPPVQTVIRLEDGRQQAASIAGSFVFTDEVRTHFAILSDALMADTGRGFFLQGDFGSGKSHFLAALTVWLTGGDGAGILEDGHSGLARLTQARRRMLPVTVSLVDFRGGTPLERILVEAVETALSGYGAIPAFSPVSIFIQTLRDLLQDDDAADTFAGLAGIDTDQIDPFLSRTPRKAYPIGVRLYKQLGIAVPEALVRERRDTFEGMLAAVKQAGFDGLVLIIDELSEFFRSKPDARALNEDARTLQLLGELSQDHPLWLIAAVQESIERTGDLSQVTFQKIKDRFAVKFTLSTVHIRALIARRLVRKKAGADETLGEIHAYIRRQFPAFSWPLDEFLAVYPVYPATIALLDGLGDLFSAHRGIVDFVHARLAGDPKRRTTGILDRPAHELLGPDSIFDHFAQRMAEFSALNVYPRHVIPHLDEVIDSILDDPDDRQLARRLVRILVLYEIHPTAQSPTARELTAMTACDLAEQDPDLNVQFVIEGILDPLVDASRFLSRKPPVDEDPLGVIFAIRTEADPVHTLKARIARAAAEIPPDDSRLLGTVLAELSESTAWPGPHLWRQGVIRSIDWQQTPRRVFVTALTPAIDDTDPTSLLTQRIGDAMTDEGADFAVVISLGPTRLTLDHTAVWEIPLPRDSEQVAVLREFFAAREIAATLRPGNPAEAPLIDPARDFLARLTPAAYQAAMATFFSGDFNDPRITVEPVIRQMKRFDRLLDRAGAVLLSDRYPFFADIAPRKVAPFPRTYQRLLDEFIRPGSLSLKKAHTSGIGDAIDGLAVPLGLVELTAGSYVFAPDPERHPLLIELFQHIRPAGKTPLGRLFTDLMRGKYGLTEEMVFFLLAALAHGGLVSLLKNDRAMPLEMIRLSNLKNVDALTLGEVIGKNDRRTLVTECSFLAPEHGWASFGLRQQRDAWQAAVKLKEKMEKTLADLDKQLAALAGFSAFDAFDRRGLADTLSALRSVLDEIKVSYPAREGLERFLTAWRGSGLTADDIDYPIRLHAFFKQHADQFIFISHYLRHPAVKTAAESDPAIAELVRDVMTLLADPDALIRTSTHRLGEAFARFKAAWTEYYTETHQAYYQRLRPRPLSRFARRAETLLRRLADIQSLDRPAGLTALFKTLNVDTSAICSLNPVEELMRTPVCACGFSPDQPLPAISKTDPDILIENALTGYLDILRDARIREAMAARIYALADADPDRAESMRNLLDVLKNNRLPAAGLLDVLDANTAAEIATALSGRVDIQPRSLNALVANLSGRRLAPDQVMENVRAWLANADPDSIVAIGDDRPGGTARSESGSATWWPLLHPSIFDDPPAESFRDLEKEVAKTYPARKLSRRFEHLAPDILIRFIITEPVHTEAIRAAWQWLCKKALSTPAAFPAEDPTRTRPVRHGNRQTAAQIGDRLKTLGQWCQSAGTGLPLALTGRLPLARMVNDPWVTTEVKEMILRRMDTLADEGAPWLAALAPLDPIVLNDAPLVVILDGLSPDVWMAAFTGPGQWKSESETVWYRLETTPDTASAMADLFGFSGDALDELAARKIPYHQMAGDEIETMADRLPAPKADQAMVIRVGMIDQGAHTGRLRLEEMPGVVTEFLKRELPWLQQVCRAQSRRLILTTDHGLSVTARGLSHGRGGVFETAIFRTTFR